MAQHLAEETRALIEAWYSPGVPLLPRGRHRTSMEDLYSLTVAEFPMSRTRAKLWEAFARLHRELRRPMRGYWICGSFLSMKLNPKDIDVLLVLRADRSTPSRAESLEWYETSLAY